MDKSIYTFAHTDLASGTSTTQTIVRPDEATYDDIVAAFLLFLSNVYGYTITVNDLEKEEGLPVLFNRRASDNNKEAYVE